MRRGQVPRAYRRRRGPEEARTAPAVPFYPEQVATLLPPFARQQLVAASKVQWPAQSRGASPERVIALERATATIKANHPEFFRQSTRSNKA